MAMNDKPAHARDYDSKHTGLIRQACLEVATRLNEFKDDLRIVGGLVPTLLADLAKPPEGMQAHIGTNDLDLGLSVAIFDEARYAEIAKLLREAGFKRDTNAKGRATSQRWNLGKGVLIDFLIEPTTPNDKGGTIRNLDDDLAAFIIPGLHLAFKDFVEVSLEGETLTGGKASRSVKVCGLGAFVVLKALAFGNRTANKDAYDLWYVIQNHPDAALRLQSIAGDPLTQEALKIIEKDFADADSIGPKRVADFLNRSDDENFLADVAGQFRQFLAAVSGKR